MITKAYCDFHVRAIVLAIDQYVVERAGKQYSEQRSQSSNTSGLGASRRAVAVSLRLTKSSTRPVCPQTDPL